MLNILQVLRLSRTYETDGFTSLFDSSCSPYAVNVACGCIGYIIVYYVGYSLDVESTCRDVCSYEDSLASCTESCKCRLAHGLGFPSMYQAHLQTYLSQLLCQLIRSPFCSCKYEHGLHLRTPNKFR